MFLRAKSIRVFLGIIYFILFLIPQAYAQNQILNNGLRRLGSGSQNSINTSGTPNQPFYKNGSTWYKLTYSTNPLDVIYAVGGTGSSVWNNEGFNSTNPVLTNVIYDYSCFTTTDAVQNLL
jgi:hypothetical protein